MRSRRWPSLLVLGLGLLSGACGAAVEEPAATELPAFTEASAAHPTVSPSVSPRRAARNRQAPGPTFAPPNDSIEPTAADTQRARDAFAKGVRAFEEGLYREAASRFEEAYTLVPNAKLLFNLGNALLKAGDLTRGCDALGLYVQYEPSPRDLTEERSQCPNL